MQAQLIGTAPTYRTLAQDRVYRSRAKASPYRQAQLPAILVYTSEEPAKKANEAPRELERTAQVVIEAMVEGAPGSELDDALDAIALQIEQAMNLDETIGGKASDSLLASTDSDVLEEGNRIVGVIRLVYGATYFSNVPWPEDQTLEDLETVTVKTSLSNAVHPTNQAQDQLEGLEE